MSVRWTQLTSLARPKALLGGLALLPFRALGGPLMQDPPPTPPSAIWMTPVGGETVPGVITPNYTLLAGIGCLVLLALAGGIGLTVFLLRRRKSKSAPPSSPGGPGVPAGYALVIHSGPGSGTRYPISWAPLVLGRAPDCHVTVNHPAVAPHHARITWDGEQFAIYDLDSPTGTFVNGYRLSGPVVFRPSDMLSLGGAVELVLQRNI